MAALKWAAVALGGAPFAVSVYALRGACAAAAAPETLRAAACEAYADWPVVALNLVYWPTFCLLFWVHSLAARSTWLIDPYWTLIPLYVYGYYASHPLACAAGPRQLLAAALLGAWSLRLSGNYWRRERYAPGAREDWRFADLRAELGWLWYPLSLPVAYGSQQGMLLGLTLPLRALFLPRAGAPPPAAGLGAADAAAAALAVLGLEVARRADAALAAFAATRKPGDVLDAGLWRASRHPNHLGEQLFWVGFAGLALAHRGAWDPCCLGFLLNHVPDTLATLPLIDARMASDTKRVRNFLKYEAAVPLIYPTPASIARAFRGAKAD